MKINFRSNNIQVKYSFLEMYIHLRIEESADDVVLLTGIDKTRTKEDAISCIRAKHGKVAKYANVNKSEIS